MSIQIKKRFPWLTLLISLVCITVFAILEYFQYHNSAKSNSFSALGAPYAIQLYMGQYWGVISNSFVHITYPHLLLNLIGLWVFGSYIERKEGFFKLFFLGLFASSITSLIQLTLSDDAGVGLSGVNFFFLTYILGKNILNADYKLRFRYIYLLIGILLIGISIYLNSQLNYTIGIEAMGSGLLIGFLTGITSAMRYKIIPVFFIVACWGIGISTLFYAPWSAEWNYYMGYQLQLDGHFKAAKKYYKAAINLNPKHSVSKENLFIITVEELSDKALDAHENERYEEARKYYDQLLRIDPHNSWAIENRNKLP